MKTKILTRNETMLFLDGVSINPVGSCQVARLGNIAMLHSLIGSGFYDMLSKDGIDVFLENGITDVYSAVVDSHLRLMKRRLSEKVEITEIGDCYLDGKRFNFIRIRPIDPAQRVPK